MTKKIEIVIHKSVLPGWRRWAVVETDMNTVWFKSRPAALEFAQRRSVGTGRPISDPHAKTRRASGAVKLAAVLALLAVAVSGCTYNAHDHGGHWRGGGHYGHR